MIGTTYFEKGLSDLAASVNLMPFSMSQEIKLGELKPTNVSFHLTDQSMK